MSVTVSSLFFWPPIALVGKRTTTDWRPAIFAEAAFPYTLFRWCAVARQATTIPLLIVTDVEVRLHVLY
jgi:hypothetical protein